MGKGTESGWIGFDGGSIRYESESYGRWSLPLAKVRVMGEYTNEDGPFADDWFLVFPVGADEWHEASAYAEGAEALLKDVGRALGAELSLSLAASTRFASRVLWPPRLAGEPLFILLPAEQGVSGGAAMFSPAVRAALT